MTQQLLDPSSDKVPGQMLESCTTAAFTLTSYPNIEAFSTFTWEAYTMKSQRSRVYTRNGPETFSTWSSASLEQWWPLKGWHWWYHYTLHTHADTISWWWYAGPRGMHSSTMVWLANNPWHKELQDSLLALGTPAPTVTMFLFALTPTVLTNFIFC